MRNQHAGPCYRCGSWVAPGEGRSERQRNGWRVRHVICFARLLRLSGRKAKRGSAKFRKMEIANV